MMYCGTYSDTDSRLPDRMLGSSHEGDIQALSVTNETWFPNVENDIMRGLVRRSLPEVLSILATERKSSSNEVGVLGIGC